MSWTDGEVVEFHGMVVRSRAMRRVLDTVRRAAAIAVPVLITGETGTGKELVANAIHAESPRRACRFVALNCAALPETLLESELFGHIKGAFTGAVRDRRGLLEEARDGTLFLDEIGDAAPSFQAKLLRVLESGEFRRVGEPAIRHADVRVIAATNRELVQRIGKGLFREDLFHRLNVIPIALPPLRQRPEDIQPLARHLARRIAARLQRPTREIEPAALEALAQLPLLGNVRELENILERSLIFADGPVLRLADLVLTLPDASGGEAPGAQVLRYHEARRRILEEFRQTYLAHTLQLAGGNVSRAAAQAGLRRQSFQQLLRKAKLRPDQFR